MLTIACLDNLGPVLPRPKSPPRPILTIFLYAIVLFYTGVTLAFNVIISPKLSGKQRVISRLIVPEAPFYFLLAFVFRSSAERRIFLAGLQDKPPHTRKTARLVKGATYYFDRFMVSSTACVLFCGPFALANVIFFLKVKKSSTNWNITGFSVGWMIPVILLSMILGVIDWLSR